MVVNYIREISGVTGGEGRRRDIWLSGYGEVWLSGYGEVWLSIYGEVSI
jgi:uncharacterized protein (AIM24 family)